MKYTLFALSLLSINLSAEAFSTGGGNGGDVFICKDSKNNMILDYYEGLDRKLYNEFGDPKLSLRENLDLWYKNLYKMDQARADRYQRFYLGFLHDLEKIKNGNNSTWLMSFTDGELQDIPDSLELVTPKDCVKHQIAIQTDKKRGDKLLKIQRQLWDQLDNRQKAVLITHEAVYNEFLESKVTDSRDARYFNQLVMSGAFNAEYFACDYLKIIKSFSNGALDRIGFGDKIQNESSYPLTYINFRGIYLSARETKCDPNSRSIYGYKYHIPGLVKSESNNNDAFLRFLDLRRSDIFGGFTGKIPLVNKSFLAVEDENGKTQFESLVISSQKAGSIFGDYQKLDPYFLYSVDYKMNPKKYHEAYYNKTKVTLPLPEEGEVGGKDPLNYRDYKGVIVFNEETSIDLNQYPGEFYIRNASIKLKYFFSPLNEERTYKFAIKGDFFVSEKRLFITIKSIVKL